MLQDVEGAIFWHTPELGRIQDLGAAPTESIQEFTFPGCCIVRMWVSPGCGSFQDLAVSSMWHFLGCVQDLFSDWIGSFPGSGTPQHAGRAPTEGDPGCGIFQDLAVSRM